VPTWGVAVGGALLALSAVGCSGDGRDASAATTTVERTTSSSSTSSTAPERPASTTTTAYDPAAVEGQIEAAYLRSWDVYAQAVYDLELDEAALAEVYAEDHLQTKRDEVQRRIDEGRASWVRIEHDYTIQQIDSSTAAVIDRYRNHQVLIDPVTKAPVEADPDADVIDLVTLKLVEGRWKVTRIEGLQ
jgi:hypothetical protein